MIIGLNISASEITFSKESAANRSLAGLRPGQTIKAKVLGMISDTKASLLLAGQKVTAGTKMPLEPGQEIQLKLVQDKDAISFRLIQPASAGQGQAARESWPGISLADFARGQTALEMLGKHSSPVMKAILGNLALKSGERDEGFLPRLLENQGLTMEKKIATLVLAKDKSELASGMNRLAGTDVKAALLRMLSQEAVASQEKSGVQTVKTMLGALENFQTLNTQAGDSSRFILPFPIMAGEAFNFGQLLIDTGQKKEAEEGKDQVIQLAFLLKMTSLGSVRADFSMLHKAITGRFLLEDEATCGYMNSLMPELKNRLQSLDFQVSRMVCETAEPKAFSPDALVKAFLATEEIQGLNLVV